jgi:transposase
MRRPGSLVEWEQKRLIAANMFELDLETKVIAQALGVDDQTVRRWRRLFKAGGREALRSGRSGGRPPRLDDTQKVRLAEMLVGTPAQCGFDRHLWTQRLIADLIEREFGVSCHHDHVGVILKRLGFTHQKPQRRARERDEARIEAWRREAWPDLLKKASRTTAWS